MATVERRLGARLQPAGASGAAANGEQYTAPEGADHCYITEAAPRDDRAQGTQTKGEMAGSANPLKKSLDNGVRTREGAEGAHSKPHLKGGRKRLRTNTAEGRSRPANGHGGMPTAAADRRRRRCPGAGRSVSAYCTETWQLPAGAAPRMPNGPGACRTALFHPLAAGGCVVIGEYVRPPLTLQVQTIKPGRASGPKEATTGQVGAARNGARWQWVAGVGRGGGWRAEGAGAAAH